MKTIILCGGTGYRLREETEFRPKPMVSVGENPILWHIMKIYAHYGFNDFILALGYKSNYIKDYFLNQKAFTSDFTLQTSTYKTDYHAKNNHDNFKITFVDTGESTQIGERILRCEKYIPPKDSHFMLTYGDGVSNVDIGALVRFSKTKNTVGTITGIHPKSRFGSVECDNNNMITKFTEKPVMNDWINGGYMVFKKKFFDYLGADETEHPAFQRLAADKEFSLFKHNGFWFSVDTYKELEEINDMWRRGDTPWKIWK